jgi:hypothetical protein
MSKDVPVFKYETLKKHPRNVLDDLQVYTDLASVE